jgi:histidinol-phosphatase (PHP family)
MTQFSNFHCHSNLTDGKGTPEDIIKKAIELKMPALGITEHCPVPFKTEWNLDEEIVDEYIVQINKLKKKYTGKIEIYCGMEIDYISEMQEEINSKSKIEKLDYIIGSIHFLGFLNDGQLWNIDGSGELFRQGMQEIFHNDGLLLVKDYYNDVAAMIVQLKPAIIGHIDKIRLHNINDIYFPENSAYYKNKAMEILEIVKNSECLVEINTRGLYKHLKNEPYPSCWMLKQMKQLGINVVISSDSHAPEDLLRDFPVAVKFLQEAGYRSSYTLQNNKWSEVALS